MRRLHKIQLISHIIIDSGDADDAKRKEGRNFEAFKERQRGKKDRKTQEEMINAISANRIRTQNERTSWSVRNKISLHSHSFLSLLSFAADHHKRLNDFFFLLLPLLGVVVSRRRCGSTLDNVAAVAVVRRGRPVVVKVINNIIYLIGSQETHREIKYVFNGDRWIFYSSNSRRSLSIATVRHQFITKGRAEGGGGQLKAPQNVNDWTAFLVPFLGVANLFNEMIFFGSWLMIISSG